MSKQKWHDPKSIFDEYQRGIDYKTALGRNGMYEQNRINQRFYIGDQWYGAQCGDERPLVRNNVIKRIGDFKIAVAAGGPVSVLYTAEGVPINQASSEHIRDKKKLYRDGAKEIPTLSDEEEINLAMSAISDYFKVTAERVKFDDLKSRVLRQAYVAGSGVLYTYWDETVRTGQFADDGKTSPIRGDIRCEVLDIENVYYGDTAEQDIQNQPYIIIAQRCRVEDVRREARRNRRPQSELDAILPDKETQYMAGDVNEKEPEGEKKITVLTKLCKVYDKESGDYAIHAVRVVKGAVIRPEWDIKLRRYPLAVMNWELARGCAYGVSEVTHIVPNQIAINRAATAGAHAVMMAGMPIMLVNLDVITEPITNDPGQVVPVYGGNDLTNAIHYEIPPNFAPQFDNLVNSLMANTMSASGANDAALGNMRPDNTSAIIALREAATVPLEMLKNNFYSFVEDVARIWAEYWVNMYNRRLKMEDEQGVWYIPFDGEKYRDLLINVRVEVGPSNLWSEIQQLQTLDSLVQMGAITQEEYLESLPKGSLPNQEKILRRLKEQAAPDPAVPEEGAGQPAAGGDPAAILAMLPPEDREKVAQMTPEQQAALAQQLSGI